MRIFGILPQLLSYFNTKGVSESIEIAAMIGWRISDFAGIFGS